MTSTEEWKNHERRLIQQIADGVSAARKRAGLSQRELAETAGLSQGAIANVEAGPSRVKQAPSVALVIRLALTLGVPPVQLLYPDLPNGEVEVWPGTMTPSYVAMQWFSGEASGSEVVATTSDATPAPPEVSALADRSSTEVTDAVRAYVALQKRVHIAAENATYAENDEQRDMMMGIYQQGLAQLKRLADDMSKASGR